jgi:5-methylcytosine-specific restriction endonuclease McrA
MTWLLDLLALLTASLTGRSGRWPAVRRSFLAAHPACAVCGSRQGVVPHHVVPVHVDRSKELDPSNLITLCPPHHLWIGHLGRWSSWNPEVVADAATWRRKIEARP